MKNCAKTIIFYVLLFCVLVSGIGGNVYYRLRFPIKYYDEICRACKEFIVEPSVVFAVCWTESKFDRCAVSRSGALGVMQLKPATAEWCCRVLNVEYKREKLFDAEFNIRLGVFYYSYLLKKFNCKEKALAAYNAGEGNVIKWMKNNEYNIEFPETKRYVKTVVSIEKIYKQKLKT